MVWLVLGVFMWSVVHLFPALMPAKRNALMAQYGNTYKVIYSIKIVVSLVLMVIGWRMVEPTQLYNPPSWGRHVTMLLMLMAVVLLGAAKGNSRIRHYVRHPMLEGVALWAVAHLFANGDSRSVVLFGGMLAWSLLNHWLINRRDGQYVKPEIGPVRGEIKLGVISVVVYLVLRFLHPYFTGVALMAH